MKSNKIHNIRSITEFHALRGLPKPEHPLVSVIDYGQVRNLPANNNVSWMLDFYLIGLKRDLDSMVKYGQQKYDFDSGVMSFMAPGQVLNIVVDENSVNAPSGTIILIHPDFLYNHTLAKKIKKHAYFGYGTNEALFLSHGEEQVIDGILHQIRSEYNRNIDRFSEDIIVAHLETLLTYADRFYNRQFLTRKISNHALLDRLEDYLDQYFQRSDLMEAGLPTVQSIAEILLVTPDYLTSILKVWTGRTCQQHIHDKLIEKAKTKLVDNRLSVSEIAYDLGFEHVQSFSKLFKKKTNQSPAEFRAGFDSF